LAYQTALKSATDSITLYTYGLTDPHIISHLNYKAQAGIDIRIFLDKQASRSIRKSLHPNIQISFVKTKGLMHEKLLIIDKELTLLGSANLTTSSLTMHDNLACGIYSKTLAKFFSEENSKNHILDLEHQTIKIHRLPDFRGEILSSLISAIDSAKVKIDIAQFTFTHPLITESLIKAQERGVKVKVAIDSYTARGASRKVVKMLEDGNVPLYLSSGIQLLHHKFANIDNQILIFGSANWTKGAFEKNQDTLLFLSPLSPTQIKFLNKLFQVNINESQKKIM
ncbi:MAG: hypothetical protein KAR79_02300, partial [Simkaniaceae bacterium]|nr:hypothetical protein [Simkaniaceae bacterium]